MNNYFDVERISNSALSCIDPKQSGHPQKFRDFILGTYKEESDALKLGDVIHEKFLLGTEFVSLDKTPTEPVMNIVDQYYEELLKERLTSWEMSQDKELLLSIIRKNNYYNNRKDETVIESVLKDGKEYFDFRVQNTGKPVISMEWKFMLEKLYLSLQRPHIQNIAFPESDTEEILSEKEIYFDWEEEDYTGKQRVYQCKAKIDRLIIDHENKTYRIIDLKSTSKYVENFMFSVQKYGYDRQLAFYRKAVKAYMDEQGWGDYDLEGTYILALETIGYNRARLFVLDESLLIEAHENILELFKRISYHEDTLNWIYPMEEEENQGIYLLTPQNQE